VDTPDGLGHGRGDRQHPQLGVALVVRHRHRVGADHLGHVRLGGQLAQGPVGEQPVRAGDADGPRVLLAQPVHQFGQGAAAGDLVVDDDDVPVGHVADDGADGHLVVAVPLLGARGHRQAQPAGERGRALGVAQVR
jgi:hypothetical protein